MAINKNHEFEDLDGIKCAIVEKNAPAGRVSFIKDLLEINSYKVVVVSSPPPKVLATKPIDGEATVNEIPTVLPETFTIGVTDVSFNTVNALYGRTLHTRDGHIVTPVYWYQKDPISHDEIPYYEAK